MSVKYRRHRVSSGPRSLRTDPEVFRNLGNALRLRGRPAVDLTESESVREPGIEAESPREPRVQRKDRLAAGWFPAPCGGGHPPGLLSPVQTKPPLVPIREPLSA